MAQCGAGSRRACEGLIAAGRVAVNGKAITQMGVTLDPRRDTVALDGRPLRPERLVYLLLNKPHDVLCTCHDPEGRRTILQYLPQNCGRLYPVGRLDRDSEGLLLITNDGALALAMTHPRYGVQKIYEARAVPPLPEGAAQRFRDGIMDDGETLHADSLKELDSDGDGMYYEVTLSEGRNRQVRRMFAAAGSEVTALRRVAFGTLRLKGIRCGACRELTRAELETLRHTALGDGPGKTGVGEQSHEEDRTDRTGPRRAAGGTGIHPNLVRRTGDSRPRQPALAPLADGRSAGPGRRGRAVPGPERAGRVDRRQRPDGPDAFRQGRDGQGRRGGQGPAQFARWTRG